MRIACASRNVLLWLFVVLAPAGMAFADVSQTLMKDLHSHDLDMRVKAATQLARLHDLDGVKTALRDGSEKVRYAAIDNLSIQAKGGERRDPRAVAIFLAALEDKDAPVRQTALRHLEDFSNEAFFQHNDVDADVCRHIARLLHDPVQSIRSSSATMLENCREPEVEKELLRVARDGQEAVNVRVGAALDLGKSSLPDIDQSLIELVNDPQTDKEIKRAAIASLGKQKSARAIETILPYLQSSDQQVRSSAAIALGEIGDPKAAKALAATLIDKNGTVDTFVLASLGKTGTSEVVPFLVKARPLITNPFALGQLAEAFGATNSAEAVEPLVDLLKDRNASLSAMAALQALDSPAALKKIIDASQAEPGNRNLTSLAKGAKRKLDFPEEALKEKKKQQEERAVAGQQTKIGRTFAKGLDFFRAGEYGSGLLLINESAEAFEKLLTDHPAHFSALASFPQREALANYYRWTARSPRKALAEYQKMVFVLDKYNKDKTPLVPHYLMMAEIYEKDLKDREKAITFYHMAADAFTPKGTQGNDENVVVMKWLHDWITLRSERLAAARQRGKAALPARTVKYPNLEYYSFAAFGGIIPGFPAYQDDLSALFNSTGDQLPPINYDALDKKYGNSFAMLSVYSAVFHVLLAKDRLDDAAALLEKMRANDPLEINVMMMHFELADAFKKEGNDIQKSDKARLGGLVIARNLNITMHIGVDPRFSSPEQTWQLMVDSLKKGDIEAACECFSPSTRSVYREQFTALKDHVSAMAADMTLIRKIKQEEGRAEYDILRNEKDGTYSYQVTFVNILGEWKIDRF